MNWTRMLADLLSKSYAADLKESWENERTAIPVRAFAVRVHAAGCSLRETQEILRLLGVKWSHQVIWQWIHRPADSIRDPLSRSTASGRGYMLQ